jgi:membrane protease subunit HflK
MSEYEGNRRSDMPEITPAMIKKIIIGIIIALLLAIGYSMFYTVEESEQAAILTFGSYTSTTEDAGLHFKMPYPIQKVVKVPANITQEIEIGFNEVNGQVVINEEEALMITGDENIVHADAIIEWKISNIPDFLYNIENGEQFLRNAATASIRSVIGSTNLDYAITEGKTEIEALVTEELLQLQEDYKTGIHVIALRFQDIQPPSGEVEQAFKDVTNAREEQNTKINNARKYENERIPVARGEAQALIEDAEAKKEARIFTAQGDVARFNAIYEEYQKNPAVTESRLIIETLEQILPNAQIFITSGDGDTVQYLPLNELMRNNTQQQGGTTQ